MKPIVRWTIGSVTDDGVTVLGFSIRNWKRLYGDRFDMVICYNNILDHQLVRIKSFGIPLIDQTNYLDDLGIEAPKKRNPAWKLYPARLRLQSHEIVIDNDLVLYKKLDLLEHFLNSTEVFFTTEAAYRSYGQYDAIVSSVVNINTGMYGLPPYFDLKVKVNEVLVHQWGDPLNEQGLLACIFSQQRCLFVKLEEIYVCHPTYPYKVGSHGMHFVGINRWFDTYWHRFNSQLLLS